MSLCAIRKLVTMYRFANSSQTTTNVTVPAEILRAPATACPCRSNQATANVSAVQCSTSSGKVDQTDRQTGRQIERQYRTDEQMNRQTDGDTADTGKCGGTDLRRIL